MTHDAGARGVPLGPYLLVKRLARGGMAEIFLARKEGPEGFSRELVVKRMLPHLSADPEFRELFREEARIVARLGHPNVAHVYDFGEDDETSYLVMELVRGVDLRALIDRARHEAGSRGSNGALPPHHAAKILSLVCEGLAHAHSLTDGGHPLGLVHRDVTPSNVLVSFEGAVKVVDFGVAKLQRSARREATQVGRVRGKYAYLSPEQARSEDLDARSDLFNVGILLFESVTGDSLFPQDEPRRARLMAASGEIPGPERFERLPAGLRATAERALAPRRADRYPDALALRADLEAFLRSQPHPSDTLEIGRYVRRLFADVAADDTPRAAGTVPATVGLQAFGRDGTAPLTAALGTSPGTEQHDTPPMGQAPVGGPAAGMPDETLGLPASDARPRRRWPYAVALGLLLAAGAGLWALQSADGPPPVPSAPPDQPVATRRVPVAEPGTLRLRTEPAGLEVHIDGEPHGPSPVLTSLPAGTHRVEVLDEGEVVATETVLVEPGGTATVVLDAPVPGWLRVRSEPPGARVVIAGEDRGETPVDVSLGAGQHSVELTLEGHEAHSDLVLVEAGREASLSVALRQVEADHADRADEGGPRPRRRGRATAGTGYLSVLTVPWSEVFLGSRRLGVTPLFRVELPAGRHTLTFRSPDRSPMRKSVRIRAGAETRVRESL